MSPWIALWMVLVLLMLPPVGLAEPPLKNVFLDTDIGSDVDDALALLTLLGQKDIRLLGISTVNGDVQRRGLIALRELELANRRDIPVAAGIGTTLLRAKQPRDWSRQLAEHLDQRPKGMLDKRHGVDLLIETIHQHPGLTVIAIGPLTNIAVAIIKDPSIVPKIGQLVVVGGATHLPARIEQSSIFVDYKSEYNLNSDPEAAQVVFQSGVPITMAGLAPALDVSVTREQAEAWKAYPSPLAQWIAKRVTDRLDSHHSNETHLGDVLGVMAALHPTVVESRTLPIHLETWGDTLRTVIDPTGSGSPVNVVLHVHKKAFQQQFQSAITPLLRERP